MDSESLSKILSSGHLQKRERLRSLRGQRCLLYQQSHTISLEQLPVIFYTEPQVPAKAHLYRDVFQSAQITLQETLVGLSDEKSDPKHDPASQESSATDFYQLGQENS